LVVVGDQPGALDLEALIQSAGAARVLAGDEVSLGKGAAGSW
jgi:hypothetical protein